jgi:hypothetical protein
MGRTDLLQHLDDVGGADVEANVRPRRDHRGAYEVEPIGKAADRPIDLSCACRPAA